MFINTDFAINLSWRPTHGKNCEEHSRNRPMSVHTYSGRWLLRRLEVCVLACKYLIKAALVAVAYVVVPAVSARLHPTGWLEAGKGIARAATVNIWLCMRFAGAECTLTVAVLTCRRINPATCSANDELWHFIETTSATRWFGRNQEYIRRRGFDSVLEW